MIGSLINESACGGVINFYDSSQYLYFILGVYTRRKGARMKPRMVERKVAQIVDIFNIAVGWKLLFLLVVQQFVLAYASRTHINARGPDIFSIRDIAQRANRIRKSSPSLFVACWVYIYIYSCHLYSFLRPFYFSPWLYFLMRKCFLLPRVIASSIRAVGSIVLLRNFLNRFISIMRS